MKEVYHTLIRLEGSPEHSYFYTLSTWKYLHDKLLRLGSLGQFRIIFKSQRTIKNSGLVLFIFYFLLKNCVIWTYLHLYSFTWRPFSRLFLGYRGTPPPPTPRVNSKTRKLFKLMRAFLIFLKFLKFFLLLLRFLINTFIPRGF